MKVKIRKATEKTYWYSDRVGDEFDVIEIHDLSLEVVFLIYHIMI